MRLFVHQRDWPPGWRLLVALPVIVAHWLLFKLVANAYIHAFAKPRTGVYDTDHFRTLELIGPPVSLIFLLLVLVAYLFISPRILLAIWAAIGAALAVQVALSEAARGREFWPDVVCILWLFAFHALLVAAVTMRWNRRRLPA